jgi:hypothetical protein
MDVEPLVQAIWTTSSALSQHDRELHRRHEREQRKHDRVEQPSLERSLPDHVCGQRNRHDVPGLWGERSSDRELPLIKGKNSMISPIRRPSALDLPATNAVASSKNTARSTGEVKDKVTISSAARELSSPPPTQSASTPPINDDYSYLSRVAHADPSKAESLARDFAYGTDYPLLDCSDPSAERYVATGELRTPERDAAFSSQAAGVRAGRTALYESEKEKGTPAAEILDKIVDYMKTQSADYLSQTGWDRLTNPATA